MSQEKYIKQNSESQEAFKPSDKFLIKKKMAKVAICVIAGISTLAGYFGHDAIDTAKVNLESGAQKVIESFQNNGFEYNLISNDLVIAVADESNNGVIELCKNNMSYDEENEPNWNAFADYVKKLDPNKDLFKDGRVLQPGDELYVPSSYGKQEESADK